MQHLSQFRWNFPQFKGNTIYIYIYIYIPPPPPPSPNFWPRGHFSVRGMYIREAPAAGISYAPRLFYAPPTPRKVFSGVGGCINFGPVEKSPISRATARLPQRHFLCIFLGSSLRHPRPLQEPLGPFGPEVSPKSVNHPKPLPDIASDTLISRDAPPDTLV